MAIQKKTEGRDLEEYLQEVWDSLEPAWDKSKFDMKQGYDSEYECDCITITSKDNEGVRAKIYVNDFEGRHPVGFDVVYRYPGDKGVGVMGSYEFQSTDMDNLGEEVFDYFDEIKKKAAGASFESDLQVYADAVKAGKYDKQSVIDDGWEFYNSVEYDEDIVRDDFKTKYGGKTYLLHITFNPSTKDVSAVKWDISAIESKQTEGLPPKKLGGNRKYRSRADLINKMKALDAVEITTPAQFNDIHNKQWLHTAGYAMDINGNLIGQTYFGDKDGKWYYATTKTFQGDYLPECKEEAKKSEARPTKQDAQIKELCKLCRNDKNVAESVFKALTKDYNTSLDPVLAGQYLMATWKSKLEELGGCNGWYDGFKKLYAAMGSDFVCSVLQDLKLGSSEIGCGACITIVNSIYDKVVQRNESKKSESYPDWIAFYFCVDNRGDEYAVYPQGVHDRNGVKVVDLQSQYSPIGYHEAYKKDYILDVMKPIPLDEVENSAIYKKLDDGEDREIIAIEKKDAERIMNASNPLSELKKVVHEYDIFYKGEGIANVKKSESLTLKQKELKDMARFGQAEDITTISDEEAKALRKKGIETIGVSRGTYGMNGALLRDNEGKKYVITARSSNLFYFV